MEEKTKRLEQRILRISQAGPLLAGVISILVIIMSFYTSSQEQRKKETVSWAEKETKHIMELSLTAKLDSMQNEVNKLKSSQSLLPQSKGGVATLELTKLENSLKDIRIRQEKLENAIMQNPVKALEVPLLKRDIETLKENQTTIIANVKNEIDRVYDLNKWLLGAMAISIITLAISNYLKAKD